MRVPAALLLLAVVAAATPEPKYFRYVRAVSVPINPGQTCLVLDPTLFPHAAPQLADLRLYASTSTEAQTETPYVIRTPLSVATSESTPQPIHPLNRGTQQGQTVFDANLPAITYSDLNLDIAAQNFIATVTVSGSQSAGGQLTTIGSYTVFDLTKQKLGRSTVLHLPNSTFPYLHFSINGPLTPEQITSLSVSRIPTKEPNYQTVATTSRVTQQPHTSKIELEIPAHIPIDRVAFTPGPTPALFSRDVTIAINPGDPNEPQFRDRPLPTSLAFAGTLLRIHSQQQGHKIDEERLSISTPIDLDYPTKWTITISNGDDQPISLSSVRLEMLERQLCFDAQANLSYALFYGDPALTAPSYDYARLFVPEPNQARTSASAQLAPEQPNPVYQPRPDERPFTEKHPILLWTALIAVIALLSLIALKSIKAAPPAA